MSRINGLPICVASALMVLLPAVPSSAATVDAGSGVRLVERSIPTPAGPRPLHMIRITPGQGAHIEAMWLGGGPGKAGTVGGAVQRNAGRGAVGGLNGDFFLLAQNTPSSGLLLHKGRYWGNAQDSKGAAYFMDDGSVIVGSSRTAQTKLAATGESPKEGIGGKPVVVENGTARGPGSLEGNQIGLAVHRTAIAQMRGGDTALIVVGGAGLSHAQFASALVRLGVKDAIGVDLNSAANLNWRGESRNRPGWERQIPTGVVVFK
jgi:Phosphodiester glycosidase